MAVLIFANGSIADPGWIEPHLASATAVIAADGGTHHLRRLDVRPNLVIGDLDSLRDDDRAWLAVTNVPIHTFPHKKDETDLELALLHAIEQYDAPIRVHGALGGRLDQTLANIMLLAHPALRGRDIRLVEEFQQAWLVSDRTSVRGEPGDTVSLIPLGGDVGVAQTSGLEWALTDSVLAFGPARGVSNVLSAETATITLSSGMLLCVHATRHWSR